MVVAVPYRDPTQLRRRRHPTDHLHALVHALASQGTWDTEDIEPALWLAAVCLSTLPGTPDELARATRHHYATLAPGTDLSAGITPPRITRSHRGFHIFGYLLLQTHGGRTEFTEIYG